VINKEGGVVKQQIIINDRLIGEGQATYVIAELGINHKGDQGIARELINEAKSAGADAVKLQTYITEKRVAKDSPIFNILKECELSFDEQKKLFDYAGEVGVDIFSTPFDDESVDFLASIDNCCYKIASFDLVNKKLLQKVAAQNKPVIMSRGMANLSEIEIAAAIFEEADLPFAILHCVSAYPVTLHDSLNLKIIQAINNHFNCPVGFSDHTFGIEIPKYAVAAGASIIEKHFTLSRENGAVDNPVSIEPKELSEMVASIRGVEKVLGGVCFGSVAEEKDILQYRRAT